MRNIKWKDNQVELKKVISEMGIDSLLIHSDSFKAMRYIDFDNDVDKNMQRHVEFIFSLCKSVHLPSFNYDFPKTRTFHYNSFKNQVGAIPSFYLEKYTCNRTFDPMFSVIQENNEMSFTDIKTQVISFEKNGYFSRYIKEGGGFLLYGTTIESLTFIHYLEACIGVVYRYDKTFKGHSIVGDDKCKLEFKSHFRPLGYHLDYDWKKLATDLVEAGVMVSLNKYCHVIDSRKLYLFWMEKLIVNNLYFLDGNSLRWVEPKLEHLGRRFLMSDFE